MLYHTIPVGPISRSPNGDNNICVLLPVFTFHIFASIFSTSLIIRSPSNSAPEKRSCHCGMIVEVAGFDRTIIKVPKGYSS